MDTLTSNLTIEKALTLTSGLPTHEGFVADIFHPPGEKFAISRAKRNIMRQPVNIEAWTKKILDTLDAGLLIQKDPRFHVLSVPKVQFIDKALGYAHIEWVEGDNLGHPQQRDSVYDYFGFESKIRGLYEYLVFMSKLNSKGQVIADHKSTSLIARNSRQFRSRSDEKYYQYSIVDVSSLDPKVNTNESASPALMWEIETGRAARAVKGGNLDRVLASFITQDQSKLSSPVDRGIYALMMPPKLLKIIQNLHIYPDAATVAHNIDLWQSEVSTEPIDLKAYESAYNHLSQLPTLMRRYPEELEELSVILQHAKLGSESDFRVASKVASLVGNHFLEKSRAESVN